MEEEEEEDEEDEEDEEEEGKKLKKERRKTKHRSSLKIEKKKKRKIRGRRRRKREKKEVRKVEEEESFAKVLLEENSFGSQICTLSNEIWVWFWSLSQNFLLLSSSTSCQIFSSSCSTPQNLRKICFSFSISLTNLLRLVFFSFFF